MKLADFGIADIFVLVDNNSRNFCQRSFEDFGIPEEHIITIPEGEHHKSLESVAEIWQVLSDQGARRNAVLVNVGGGVITDLGGFAASCFKRGIHCVNIPTTLLAQIDASVGGKTGFDFNGLKNEIGSFAIPDCVHFVNRFLATLPERQIMSGFAEMLKHALLADEEHVAEAMQVDFAGVAEEDFLKLIRKSVAVKAAIVQSDPREKGLRKALNFGHTVGHAFELAGHYETWTHGQAVAAGMVRAAALGEKLGVTPAGTGERIAALLKAFALPTAIPCTAEEYAAAVGLDKKGSGGDIQVLLLEEMGKAVPHRMTKAALLEELK